MGKSERGPDMQDCSIMMVAMGELHGVHVSLTVRPGGGSDMAAVEIVAVAVQRTAPNQGQQRSVSRKHTWPNTQSKRFEGTVYRLLHELDRDCGTFWQQEEFNQTA